MKRSEANKLAKYHKFTRKELYEILVEAFEKTPKDYWEKPSTDNPIFSNGWLFNLCKKIIGYEKDNPLANETVMPRVISFRVLRSFGKFSKIQLPKAQKPEIKMQKHEIPTLD